MDSIKLQTRSIAVSILKGGLHLFSVPNLETRFIGPKLDCKVQEPILIGKHQVTKTLDAYAIFSWLCVIYEVESWSEVLEWSHGVESWSGLWSGI